MMAYDYPVLGFFWSVMIFFLWVLWFMLLFYVLADIFRSHDMGGWAKALWIIFVILVPFLGVLVYVIVRGDSMTKRSVDQAQAQRAAMDDYIRQTATAGGGTAADELTKLAALRDQGVLTQAEFDAQKAKLLG
jgi:Short C-terminal domain/Phospholipase_D-nuclease N-terminal